jgi:hypothetical protein
MANNLYDTGGPQRVIVVNAPSNTGLTVADAQRIALETTDRLMENLVDYLARRAAAKARPAPREAFRQGPATIDASFEVVPRQLPPAKKGK